MSRQTLRRFGVLFTGTAASQLLPVVTTPIIARHYDANEFGTFGLFVATSAILVTFANLKYETAILSARSQREVKAILGLCILINAALGMVIGVAVLAATGSSLLVSLHAPALMGLILPISFLLAGSLQALSSTALRGELFTVVARGRFIAAAATAGLSLLAALTHPTSLALMLASLTGQLAGIISLMASPQLRGISGTDFRIYRLRLVARKYWRFALFTSPADLLNALASNLPAVFLGALFGNAATGAYVLAQRLIGTPLMLIGSAFSDLYRQKVGQRSATNNPYWDITLHLLLILIAIGAAVLTMVLMFGTAVSQAFLGSQWNLVGEILQLMIFVYIARFVVSPLTYTYYLAHKHSEDLVLQTCSATSVWILYRTAETYDWPLAFYVGFLAVILSAVYFVYGARSLIFAHASLQNCPNLSIRAPH